MGYYANTALFIQAYTKTVCSQYSIFQVKVDILVTKMFLEHSCPHHPVRACQPQ